MRIVSTLAEVEQCCGGAFVPTMGALHEGHLSLVRRAADIVRKSGESRPVVISIFVNPTQFDDPADLERYPRDLASDAAAAAEAGAEFVFAPAIETVYPPGNHVPIPALPAVATQPGLEDRFRPGHFAGVCQVVARLFDLLRPRWALFGEKDYQQLRVIESLVEGQGTRWPGLEIVSHHTLRDPDGLAMSSRNRLLSPEARRAALGIHRALREAQSLAAPGRDVRRVEQHMRATLVRHQLEVEYAAVRDSRTLMPIDVVPDDAACRALIAARVGGVRLIDNAACPNDGQRETGASGPEGPTRR